MTKFYGESDTSLGSITRNFLLNGQQLSSRKYCTREQ